jgi:preprotein translocase subunit SecD
MNKYPIWKYIVIAIALVVALIYALPNFFGEVPAVQISGLRSNKVDDALTKKIEDALKQGSAAFDAMENDAGVLKVRFADTDTQLKARDIIQAQTGPGYVVALNLIPNSPKWLAAIGAKPMSLGLDLRGGVHFLMQVDMKAAATKAVERYLGDVRGLLRDRKIYYSGLNREGERINLRFRERETRAAALAAIGDKLPDLALRETESGDEFQIVASVKPEIAKKEQDLALQQNIQTLRNRVNELGVAEPIVQQQGGDRIVVELAGVQDPGRAKDIIGRTATLEVRLVAEDLTDSFGGFEQYKNNPVPISADRFFDVDGRAVLVRKSIVITGDRIKDAQPGFDPQTGRPIVSLRLDEAGGRVMLQTTRENVKKRMAMMLIEKNDTKVLTWPSINGEFGSNFMITGMPDTNEAKNLALLLRSGALAAPMEFIEERTVGPSLGAENIAKGKNSVIYGFIAIALFMIAYYMLFGAVSVVALASNLLFLVALLSMLQATLTLPGIAAIALALGMAIDANVLINERVREELRNGMSPQMAITTGYDRAFGTILDSNITTLIAGLALLIWGSGPVRGFAIVHCLGIMTSIFSAVMVSRGMVNLIYGSRKKVAKLSIGNTEWQAAALKQQSKTL